jgi:hypothetical protein
MAELVVHLISIQKLPLFVAPFFICRGLFLPGLCRQHTQGDHTRFLLLGKSLWAFRQPELIRSADDPRIRGQRNIATMLAGSVPIFFRLTHVCCGMNTIPPACRSRS